MDVRREQLVRLLRRRRRRVRLLLVCLTTALGCGLVAGIVGPEILIGGVSYDGAPSAAAKSKPGREATRTVGPMDLSDRLGLDPRETQANAIRWQPALSN